MYVADHMTKNPTCIAPDTAVSKALDIMDKNNFHRLPVVDSDGKLIGLVTEGLISGSTGKNNTSLSIYELNYLLSRTKVSDIMVTEIFTITPDVLVEEAAVKMRSNNISVLPVVDLEGKVVGIITENDIFDAFIDLLGYHTAGTRFVINVQEDHPGILEELAGMFSEKRINLLNLAVYYTIRGVEVVILAKGSCPQMREELTAKGYNVTDMLVRQNS